MSTDRNRKAWEPGDLPEQKRNHRGQKDRGSYGAMTALYLAAIEDAARQPGKWGMMGRVFNHKSLATSTASCIRNGHLRVRPLDGDPVYEHTKETGEVVKYLGLRHNINVAVRPAKDETWRIWMRVVA